uniref:Uncharacterized protein n=1 Tax=Ditylenchus dipsaci TaxID=166011 RepID=A0A915CSX9_9BILA
MASNIDACSLTCSPPEYLRECVEKSAALQTELKKICANTKATNAKLHKNQRDKRNKEKKWVEKPVRTTKSQLDKCMADSKIAEEKLLEEKQKNARLGISMGHLEQTLGASQHKQVHTALVKRSRKRPQSARQQKPSSKLKRKHLKPFSNTIRASSEPFSLAAGRQFASRPSPIVLGDVIMLSDDDQEHKIAVSPPVTALNQIACPSTVQEDSRAVEEPLPPMVSSNATSPTKKILKADTVVQGKHVLILGSLIIMIQFDTFTY